MKRSHGWVARYDLSAASAAPILPFGLGPGIGQATLQPGGRLMLEGSLQSDFFLDLQEPLTGDLVEDLHPYLDGSVLVSGEFIRVSGQPIVNLGRLGYDGTPDPGFIFDAEPGSQNGAPGSLYTYGVQADERAVIDTSYRAEILGLPITARFQRVLRNGALDFGFDFSPTHGLLTSGSVVDASQAAEGCWSVVGDLYTYDFTQIPYHNISRFTTQDAARQSLEADPGLTRIDWPRSGNSPALEHTHFEISLDGETWIDVGRGEPIPGGTGLLPASHSAATESSCHVGHAAHDIANGTKTISMATSATLDCNNGATK